VIVLEMPLEPIKITSDSATFLPGPPGVELDLEATTERQLWWEFGPPHARRHYPATHPTR
jgi:hypothetical protein